MIDVPAAAASLRMPADRRVFFGPIIMSKGNGPPRLLSVKRFWRGRVRYIAYHYAHATVVDWMEALPMPNMMSWFQLRGRMVKVTSGPLRGLSGALQTVSGDHASVGYRDGHGYFSTFEALLTDLTPELKESEELSG